MAGGIPKTGLKFPDAFAANRPTVSETGGNPSLSAALGRHPAGETAAGGANTRECAVFPTGCDRPTKGCIPVAAAQELTNRRKTCS
ncbi:hypothetical protein [Kamptonema formosum]|uniref:hypothetical protein n=1 Tax=Kamptonema formosum TaxID=331992 RepID=UPI000348DFA8|nr:hypothetical protein [Oscillatoria sp. PCC 10802]